MLFPVDISYLGFCRTRRKTAATVSKEDMYDGLGVRSPTTGQLIYMVMLDSAAVVAWVSNNIEHFGGQADQIFLMGHSAGGHIAALLTVNECYLGLEVHQNIRGFIGLAAPYDFIFDKPYMHKLFAGLDYSKSQPSHFIDGNEPPLLLLYGSKDKEVYMRNIVNMTKSVRQKGGKAEPHIYDGVDHVDILAALSIPYRGRTEVMNDIADFLGREADNTHSNISNIQESNPCSRKLKHVFD